MEPLKLNNIFEIKKTHWVAHLADQILQKNKNYKIQQLNNEIFKDIGGLPWWSAVKNPPSNVGHTSSISGLGTKIPHATGQLSPYTTTTEPAHHTQRAHTLCSLHTTPREPTHSAACMPQLERSPHATTKILYASVKTRQAKNK